jgi:hypothetical protein
MKVMRDGTWLREIRWVMRTMRSLLQMRNLRAMMKRSIRMSADFVDLRGTRRSGISEFNQAALFFPRRGVD